MLWACSGGALGRTVHRRAQVTVSTPKPDQRRISARLRAPRSGSIRSEVMGSLVPQIRAGGCSELQLTLDHRLPDLWPGIGVKIWLYVTSISFLSLLPHGFDVPRITWHTICIFLFGSSGWDGTHVTYKRIRLDRFWAGVHSENRPRLVGILTKPTSPRSMRQSPVLIRNCFSVARYREPPTAV